MRVVSGTLFALCGLVPLASATSTFEEAEPLLGLGNEIPYQEKWFTQKIDNFRFDAAAGEWKQRYLISDHFYKPGGGILFYCGNEGTIDHFWQNTGFVQDIASELNPGPLLVYGEHRFYGKSWPYATEEESFKPANLFSLTSAQALEDFAQLIDGVKTEYKMDGSAKVVVFGGSYGGMLAAWMRYRYPHIVTAAYASSAPVRMFRGSEDERWGYFDSVIWDFKNNAVGEKCGELIHHGFQAVRQIGGWESNVDDSHPTAEGLATLSSEFNTCEPLKSASDVRQLQYFLMQAMVSLAQTDYPQATKRLPASPVSTTCQRILDVSRREAVNAVQYLRALADVAYNFSGKSKCHDIYSIVQCADRSGCGGGGDPSANGWAYQACAESFFPMGVRPGNKVMPEDILWTDDEIAADCMKRFGVKTNFQAIPRQFTLFESASPYGSRILWTNGDRDPWHKGGIWRDTKQEGRAAAHENPIYMIEGGAHHLELRKPDDATDPESVKLVRARVMHHVLKWMGQGPNNKQRLRGADIVM